MDVWALSAAVYILALGTVSADDTFSCNMHFDLCSCSAHTPKLFELLCPELDVQVQINLHDSVQLQCSNTDSMGFSTLSDLHIGDVDRFILRLCPLPDIAITELMARLGINKIKMLQIQSYSNLNDTLEKKHFEKLFDLTNLSLNNNGLTSLPSNIFEDMGNLTWLDMKYNFIDLPKEIFYFTPKLEVLELGMNNLTHLIPGIFKNLDHLRLLNLWNNKLTNLTRSVFSDVPNLESLDLNTNQMENIRPDLFADLIKLKRLNLHANRFASLPQGLLSGNIYLEEFQIHENNRSITLPSGFLSNLIKLKMVKLSGSKIMTLPENTFSGSKNILTIYLNGNSLSTLSNDTFADLESLEHLDLSVNNIEYLPEKLFYYNSNLKTLKLDYNNIMEIPLGLFLQLQKLEYLDLRFNKIKSITGEQFYGLPSLKTLNISDNQLTSVGLELQLSDLGMYSVFKTNTQLEDLQLANNSLSGDIYIDWRMVMNNLRILNLSFNQYRFLKTDDFEFIGNTFLDLSNNNISLISFWDAKVVAAGIVNNFRSSYERDQKTREKIIKLDNNPFNCDCQMLPFIQFLHDDLSPEVQYLYNIPKMNLKCKEPANLEKMSLSYVPYCMLTCEFKENTENYTCPENCVCQYRAIDKGNIINCQNKGLKQIPESLPTYNIANHTELYLEKNQLRDIKITTSNKGYENVTHLSLADNNISSINTSGFSKKLKVLDLTNNNLTSLETIQFLEKAVDLESLLLIGNPWHCDCAAKSVIRLIKNRFQQVKLLSNVTCSDGRSLETLDDSELCPESVSKIALAGMLGLLGLLAAMLTIMYYRNQTEIHIYCYSSKWKLLRWIVSRPDEDENKIYDAFISYAHEDEDFVTHHLVPYLEETGETKFKLCLHFRDWIIGEAIPIQILNSVKNSRRTIVVLSPSFLRSVWGKMEFKTAHQQAMEDGKTRVIAVLYEDVGQIKDLDEELKAYLQMNTYLKWGSPWFWQQLNYALPHPKETPDDIHCIFGCLQRNQNNRTNNILQSVQIKDGELQYVGDKSEKPTDKDKGSIIISPSFEKAPPLIIEEVDTKPKIQSSNNHQNGKVAIPV